MGEQPFLLSPAGKDYLWGGQRLNTEYQKSIDLNPLAETWECSTHPDGPSTIASGDYKGILLSDLIKRRPKLLGRRHNGEDDLSILIKLIDAKQDLSVQVHPDDTYAYENEKGQRGKTEMWYVLDADKDAKLIYGLAHQSTKEEISNAIETGTIMSHLQYIDVHKDDVFVIHPGIIHAIGRGVLIAEIQENSNITYRLYDYDRTDCFLGKRQLHIDKALDVMNLSKSDEPKQPMRVLKYRFGEASEMLFRCKYFEVFRMLINTERKQQVHYQTDNLSFRVMLCIEGCGTILFDNQSLLFFKGDCIFVPADSVIFRIHGKAQFLDIRG